MSGQALRVARDGDVPALRALWREVFQDEDAVLDAFFDCLFVPEDTLLAERGGEIVSAAYLLRGVRLCAEGARRPAAYFYALGTRPDCRGEGLGRAVTRACVRLCAGRGETLCLMPGEESLRRWYAGFAGMKSFGTAREITAGAAPDPGIGMEELDAEAYVRIREAILADTPHAAMPAAFFRFQERLCRLGGGALLALHGSDGASGLACAGTDGETAVVSELLWPGEPEEAAAAIAEHFAAASCAARLPGAGAQTVMGTGETPCAPFWWGPVFD